ncbi:MAG: hypothetical protein GXP29_00775 [Planctomycetes bacterium]|nr:hypothetical protein [Planctomycetota bacterium]
MGIYRRRVLPLLAILIVSGCTFNLDLGAETLFPEGSAFVLSGTTDIIDTDDGQCNVWIGENGVAYHLFQSPRIDNGDFDRITTPGVTSRLEVATRNDLVVSCQVGTIVTVEDVLEIVP